jgi:hypothetical protein
MKDKLQLLLQGKDLLMQERYQFEQRSKDLSQVNQHLTSKNTVLQEQLNGFK